MPELPDVEIFRRYLNATALHQKIQTVRVHHDRVLKGISKTTLQRRLKGQELKQTTRHGKHLFAALSKKGWLMLHFGMTGFLRYFKAEDKMPGHVRMEVLFSNGYRLAYDCQRMLGQVSLVEDPRSFAEKEKLGPDALEDLDVDTFRTAVSGRRGKIKSTLMNQEVVAGIGNIYADEILFQARLHPAIPANTLDNKDFENLYRCMDRVWQESIDAGADPDAMPDDFLLPHRSEKDSCPRCGGPVKKITISGRSGYYCPKCQKKDR